VKISCCVWAFCVAAILRAAAQDAPPPSPAYLLRLERLRGLDDACILVRSDGPYHLEKAAGDNVDVYEGDLPADTLQQLERWVSTDELFQLTQDKIVAPIFSQGKDELVLAVNRPGYWQNLTFPAPPTWQPYQKSVAPLSQWFDEALNAKHRQKRREEEARNNCIPPREIKLATRPAAPKGIAIPDFVFVIRDMQVQNDAGTKTCSIVYPDGRYHREVKAQKMDSNNVTTAVYEGHEAPDDLRDLKSILATPDLLAPRGQTLPSGGMMMEGEIVTLILPENRKLRTILFWKYVPAGLMGARRFDESGMKELDPLAQWVKAKIDARSDAPVANGSLNDCVPVRPPE
jgi:hypothetical protein